MNFLRYKNIRAQKQKNDFPSFVGLLKMTIDFCHFEFLSINILGNMLSTKKSRKSIPQTITTCPILTDIGF